VALALQIGPVITAARGQAATAGFPKADPMGFSDYVNSKKSAYLPYGGSGLVAWHLALDEARVDPSLFHNSTPERIQQINTMNGCEVNLLCRLAPEQWKAIYDKSVNACALSPTQPAEFDRLEHECASELRQLWAKVRTKCNAEQARPLIEALLARQLTRENKAHAEDLLDQIEDLVPCDPQLADLRKIVAGMPGPAHRMRLDLGDFVALRLLRVEAGQFMMGLRPQDKVPLQHIPTGQAAVTLTKPFYLSVCPVTNDDVATVLGVLVDAEWMGGQRPRTYDAGYRLGEWNHYAANVYWNDAVAFCQKLSLKVGHKVRPPTEAEWEYACRAGTTTRYFWGDDWAQADPYVFIIAVRMPNDSWPQGVPPFCVYGPPRAIDLKRPNPWGFHGFFQPSYGEWCLCCGYYPPSRPLTDPPPLDRLPLAHPLPGADSKFVDVFAVCHGAAQYGVQGGFPAGGHAKVQSVPTSGPGTNSTPFRIVIEAP
jgi:hypothetical protein